MTQTIDTVCYDREFSTGDSSSVIDHVYYSTDQQILVVQLFTLDWNDQAVLAAYEGVPESVYRSLEIENSNRLNGSSSSSVGRYWNIWIKPYYRGIDTSGIDLLSVKEKAEEEARLTDLRKLVQETADIFTRNAETESAPVSTSNFVVHFDANKDADIDDAATLLIVATDVPQALSAFNKIAELAGWQNVNVLAVTQFLN